MNLSPAIEARENEFFSTTRDFNNPPLNFEVEINTKNNNSNNNNGFNCRLCSMQRKRFICKKCLQHGTFNNNSSEERFIDKQHKLKNLKNAQLKLSDQFNSKFDCFKKIENLRVSIIKYREKNDILKDLIRQKQDKIQKLQEIKKNNHERNRSQRMILPRYEDKVNKLGDYVSEASEKNEVFKRKCQNQMSELKKIRRDSIEKLVKYIFPIAVRQQQDEHECDYPLEYTIADGPSLPSSGDYFEQYSKWITSNNKNEATSPTSMANEEANRVAQISGIVAALTYFQQLVQGISFFLDIRLPHKISHNDFCKIALNEPQFRKKVSRLNLNVVYLTYMQNVPTRNIQPARTVENILLLIDAKNESLGQTSPIQTESDTKSIDSIILSFTEIADDESGNMSDFDSEDDHKEWENVSPTNISPASLDATQSALIPESSSSGMTKTLRNVAHSLWKGWK